MTAPTAAGPTSADRARRAVSFVFIGSGTGLSTFASRIPQLRDGLDLSPAVLGLVLLSAAVGSLIALPTAGLVVHRLGAARTVTVMAVICTTGLAIVGVGSELGVGVVVAGLLLLGFGNGAWDVAMNVEAAEVERRLGRSIMSRFHAGFSVGTVAGALVGAGMNALDVPVIVHLVVVAGVLAVAVPWSTRSFLPADVEHAEATTDATAGRHPMAAWKERRTVLIGLFVLTMAFAEGTGNDWLGVAAIDGHGASDSVGSLAYVVFVASMTTGRWFGARIIDRLGRVVAMRASAVVACVGVSIVVFGPGVGTAMVGAVLWGLGVALGFPTGMSAAADDARFAAGRVSVVATIGYVAFLTGPAVIGLVGDRVGVLRALTVTAALLAIAFLLAASTRPLEESEPAAVSGTSPLPG